MPHIRSPLHAKTTGFTLIELLITLALMGILAAWGLPSFQALGERSAVASEVNRLQTALTLARNTAITQRSDVTVCPANEGRTACNGDWSGSIMVVVGDKTSGIVDGDIVRVFSPTQGVNVSQSNHGHIMYNSLGHIDNCQIFSIRTINGQTVAPVKYLEINGSGRARVVDEDPNSCAD